MSDTLLSIYEGMLKEAEEVEEVEEKEEEIDEAKGKGLGPGKGKGDGNGDGSGTCEKEEIDEAKEADSAIVSKVQKILAKADKRTLMTIAQWIDKESDKVK